MFTISLYQYCSVQFSSAELSELDMSRVQRDPAFKKVNF